MAILLSLVSHIISSSSVYIIEKLLFIENTHTVRMLGFELLLLFLEVMGTPDKFKLALLTASMNFPSFVHDFYNRDVKFPHPIVSSCILVNYVRKYSFGVALIRPDFSERS